MRTWSAVQESTTKEKQRILIVDDEPNAQYIFESMLLHEGYRLSYASRGREALAQIDELEPDLILLDVMMPEMDGFEVCRHIKSVDRWRHIPVILITALDGKNILVRGLDAGADEFVTKPVTGSELRARVRSMLRIKTQYDLLHAQRQQLDAALKLSDKLANDLAQHLEELRLLHEVGLRLMSNLDTDSVLSLISQTSFSIVPKASQCLLHFLVSSDQPVLTVSLSPYSSSKIVHPEIGIEDIVKQAIEARTPICMPDASREIDRLVPPFDEMRALLVMPLHDDHHTLGALSIYSREANVFEEGHRHVLSILANQASVAINKARYFEERDMLRQREREAVRELFERYVSPRVVDRLLESIDPVVLGGQRHEISVLFADIPGFTTYSEQLPPERLVSVLNQYLGLAIEMVQTEDGTLDKFMGDAVMAFFNAPVAQNDHTLRAVRAALAMQRTIESYNERASGRNGLIFNIGIHTGPAIVGNVGTMQHMNYTAIGDTVNLAKRLQETAHDGQIIMSREAYESVKEMVVVQDMGSLIVKGRSTPVDAFLLLSLKDN
jgi:class 3 adenylate cyclase/DNA-binding response OmpR family regulator